MHKLLLLYCMIFRYQKHLFVAIRNLTHWTNVKPNLKYMRKQQIQPHSNNTSIYSNLNIYICMYKYIQIWIAAFRFSALWIQEEYPKILNPHVGIRNSTLILCIRKCCPFCLSKAFTKNAHMSVEHTCNVIYSRISENSRLSLEFALWMWIIAGMKPKRTNTPTTYSRKVFQNFLMGFKELLRFRSIFYLPLFFVG